MAEHRKPVFTGGEFPRFVVSVDTLESGRMAVHVYSDNDERVDDLLEAAGVKMKFSIANDMMVGEVQPALAIELLQQVLGVAVQQKRQLTDKQRAARAANAAKARTKRHVASG